MVMSNKLWKTSPDQFITENCNEADRKYLLNFSETTNDFAVGFGDTGIIKGKHKLI
jgi:hypothetical protein